MNKDQLHEYALNHRENGTLDTDAESFFEPSSPSEEEIDLELDDPTQKVSPDGGVKVEGVYSDDDFDPSYESLAFEVLVEGESKMFEARLESSDNESAEYVVGLFGSLYGENPESSRTAVDEVLVEDSYQGAESDLSSVAEDLMDRYEAVMDDPLNEDYDRNSEAGQLEVGEAIEYTVSNYEQEGETVSPLRTEGD